MLEKDTTSSLTQIDSLILAYFRDRVDEYSYIDISNQLGIPLNALDARMDKLVDNGYLSYSDYLLRLTTLGRLKLMQTISEFVDYNSSNETMLSKVDPTKAKPLNEPYIPKVFLSKINKKKKPNAASRMR